MLGDCRRCGHPWVRHRPNDRGGYSCLLCKCKRQYPEHDRERVLKERGDYWRDRALEAEG